MLDRAETLSEWAAYVDAVNRCARGAGTVDTHVSLVGRAYMALPGRDVKIKGRALLDDAIVAYLEDDRAAATRLAAIRKRLREQKWKVGLPPRKQQSADKYRELTAAVQIAFGILVTEIPDDLADVFDPDTRWWEKLPQDNTGAVEYRRWLLSDPDTRGPEPEATEVDKKAARIALGRAPGASGRPPLLKARRT